MQQIVDLHNDPDFQNLNVALISLARDSAEEQAADAPNFGIQDVPLLVDADTSVAAAYDVMKWALANGEPGHTFVLVDAAGNVAWIRDYGAPDLAERTMYVPIPDLVSQIAEALR